MNERGPDARTPLLLVEDLSFRYPNSAVQVLDRVSLRLERGSSVGILGRNGAGKSTLLAAIVDAVHGTRTGRVEVAGGRLLSAAVGFATQAVTLYPTLTVEQNIRHVAYLFMERSAVKHAVAAALDEYGIAPLATTEVRKLSFGQQRMTHLAASFVYGPPVRLIDEPTTSLDFEARLHFVDLTRQWRRQGVALVVTSHYPEDIEDLCDEIVLLNAACTLHAGSLASFLALVAESLAGADGAAQRAAPLRDPGLSGANLRSVLVQFPNFYTDVAETLRKRHLHR